MNVLMKLGVFLVICYILSACGSGNTPPPNPATVPVPVNLYEVHPEMAVYYDNFPGTVVAMMQVDLRSQVEGYVTGMFFTEGAHVTKDQKLYTIDDRKYQASTNQAEANVKVAEANLAQAQKDADRYVYLNQHEAVAKQTLDHAITTLQNAKQQLTAAKQELARTQTDVGYSIIKAPFDGTIGLSQVKLGNIVVPGQTVLNTISTEDPMAVDFVVNEKQIARFTKLQNHKAISTDSIFTILLPDNTTYPHTGQIKIIDRGVNPQTGAIIVRLVFPNPSSMLRAGMSCTVRVRNDDTTEQLLVPSKAIVPQMGEYFVYVARDTVLPDANNDKQKDNRPKVPAMVAVQKKVTLGQTIADQVIIKTGLETGDKVIIDGIQTLHAGSLVTTGEKKKETAK